MGAHFGGRIRGGEGDPGAESVPLVLAMLEELNRRLRLLLRAEGEFLCLGTGCFLLAMLRSEGNRGGLEEVEG
jgi:hypothetical protein